MNISSDGASITSLDKRAALAICAAPAIFSEQVLHVAVCPARLISRQLKQESKIVCACLNCNLPSKNKAADNCLIHHPNGLKADQHKYARWLLPLAFLVQAPVSQAIRRAPTQSACMGIAGALRQSPASAELALGCLPNRYPIRCVDQGPCLSFER